MKISRFILIPALILCGHTTQGDGSATSSVADVEFRIPLLYETYWDLPALTKRQQMQLETVAEALKPEETDIWFSVITDSGELRDSGLHFSALVYYTPNTVFGRIWKGKVAYLISIKIDGPIRLKKKSIFKNYYQIWSREKLPASRTEVPPINLVPFTADETFDDRELIEIVDFARSQFKRKDGPIVHVQRDGDFVKVTASASRRLGAGHGMILNMKKKGGKWVVENTLKW